MPPPMPKHLAKGGVATMLGERYRTEAQALDALKQLRQKHVSGAAPKLVEIGTMAAAGMQQVGSTGQPSDPTGARMMEHFRNHWLGENDYIDPGKETTGWWHGWKGDPDGVLREALERALEIALGIDHVPTRLDPENQPQNRPPISTLPGTNPSPSGGLLGFVRSLFFGGGSGTTATGGLEPDSGAGQGTRNLLPVDTYWICGLPKFEAYVCWNPQQVTLIVLTPGFSYPVTDPERDDPWVEDFPTNERDDKHVNEGVMRRPQGILFVGQNVEDSSGMIAKMAPEIFVNNLHNAAPPTPTRAGIGAP